jgi:hypothetical protein
LIEPAAPAPQGFDAENQERGANDGREVLAAWLLVLLAVAIAVLLLVCHEPATEDFTLPRWYDPPVAAADVWADELMASRDGDVLPASGSSARRRLSLRTIETRHPNK